MFRARPRHRLSGSALLLMISLISLISLISEPARAAVRVIAADWHESADAAPDARRRASRWTDVLGLRMVQVLSTKADDRFAETIAVFERSEPVAAEAFAHPERALADLSAIVGDLVGADPPVASELRTLPSGEQIAWAQWRVDDLVYECVLVPSGQGSSLLVAAVLESQLGDHRIELDRIYAGLEGVTEPMPAFSLPLWRWGSVMLWIALAVALHFLMLKFVDRDNDHRQAGMRAVAIALPITLVGTLIARGLLLERALALAHAGTSVAGLVTWIGVAGLSVIGLHVLLAQRADQGIVRSAPATGAFASGTYSTADMVRSTIQRAALRDPSAASGSWARPRRLDPDDSGNFGAGDFGVDELGVGESQQIIIDDAERLPPAP